MRKSTALICGMFVLTAILSTADAAAPAYIPLQGVLTDENGTPLNESVDIRFTIYDAETGGTALWTEQQSVLVEDGLFTVYLGQDQPLDLSIFRDNGDLWLGTRVGADQEMPTVFLGSAPFSGFAEHCGNIPAHTHEYTDMIGEATSDNVGFNYAGSTTKGGPATDLFCTDCIQTGEIQDGEVTQSDVGFNYAGSSSKGGAASMAEDLSCSGCVSSSEVDFNYAGSVMKDGKASNAELLDGLDSSAFAPAGHTHPHTHRIQCKTAFGPIECNGRPCPGKTTMSLWCNSSVSWGPDNATLCGGTTFFAAISIDEMCRLRFGDGWYGSEVNCVHHFYDLGMGFDETPSSTNSICQDGDGWDIRGITCCRVLSSP
jgi:hypothetical protein